MIINKALLLVAFFSILLNANEKAIAIKKAASFERDGDIKNAMIWYKKAALSFSKDETVSKKIDIKKNIISYGKNDIKSYGNKQTDATVSQIIYSTFDVKPYRANYLLPATYDNVIHNDGRKNFETKFQFSFKKEIANNLLGLNEKLFMAYTQISWWQTSANSSPFRETNYEPQMYMLFPYYTQKTSLKAYKIGLVHQSNGQEGLNSRSWNRLYLGGIFQYHGFFIEPRVWYRFKEAKKTDITQSSGDDNPDIQAYLGYGDLKITYPYKKNLITLLLRNNLNFNASNRGAIQLDWSFPIFGITDLFGYLQIFSGYGESLIDYNKRSNKIGIGFSLSR